MTTILHCRRCGDDFAFQDIDEAFVHMLYYHSRVAEVLYWDWQSEESLIRAKQAVARTTEVQR